MGEGSRVKYKCIVGYKIVDENATELLCQDGEWIGPAPTCGKYHSVGVLYKAIDAIVMVAYSESLYLSFSLIILKIIFQSSLDTKS